MKTNRQALHFEAMAYALGAIFLLTVSGGNLVVHVFGWGFIVFALFLIVQSFPKTPLTWVDHSFLSLPLFVVTTADFILESVNSHQAIYIVLAGIFLIILIIAILWSIARGTRFTGQP